MEDDDIEPSSSWKRRRLNDATTSKAWDSQDDSGEDFTADDFETVATMPLVSQKRKQLQYGSEQLRSDLSIPNSSVPFQTAPQATQPTHIGYATQPTQPLVKRSTPPYVQVERSSPTAPETSSSPKPLPPPIRRAPFAKPGGLMAPPGTTFRPPPGIVKTKPPVIDLDSDEDPPVEHSDDETQTQGLSSNIRPTQFKKGGRGLDSSPDTNRVRQSPLASSSGTGPSFSALLSRFTHTSSGDTQARSAGTDYNGDMASAYGGITRLAKPTRPTSSSAASASNGTHDMAGPNSLEDIADRTTRDLVQFMRSILSHQSVKACHDALIFKRGDAGDAMDWLSQQEEAQHAKDELDFSPIKKGVARSSSQYTQDSSSQPVRLAAKQQVNAPIQTIAEKYASKRESQKAIGEQNLDDDDVVEVSKVRRRLQQGRRSRVTSTSPPSSPPPQGSVAPTIRHKKPVIVVEDDDESDSGVGRDMSETPAPGPSRTELARNRKLLELFNTWSAKDLAELCGRPVDMIEYLISKRPFSTLDEIRAVSIPRATKRGKPKPIGDMLVDDCSEMLTGYDAVDVLVEQCEKIAKPLQKALRGWGVGDVDGELHMTKLDEAHDSGIGTPSSTGPSDDPPASVGRKGTFIGQPENMNPELLLKDYQLVGLNWLNLLFSKGLSCILADDMGLGKTCQVIGFLSYLKLQKIDGVHLVVVPASTLENWLREIDRFSPELVVRPYYGLQAERFQLQAEIDEDFGSIDVIVTTYDMMAGKEDNKFFRRLGPFSVCVYDEAHVLRNPNSKRYAQLVKIQADFKVLLTGTPLQNNLQELIAILAFIMPELFEEQREDLEHIFKHKATTKDTSHAALLSAERINRARTMMTPFILRRKKEQVLELPKKTSRFDYCEMNDMQAKHYAGVLNDAQSFYANKAAGATKASAKASANVIMSLRKAAIHPLLSRRLYDDKKIDQMVTAMRKAGELGGNGEHIKQYLLGEHHQSEGSGDFYLHGLCLRYPSIKKFALKKQEWMDSAKVDKLSELVTKYIEHGDRVLIFSQFTMAMDILEAVFETLNIKFMRLDGSTRVDTRQEMIDRFSNDPSIPVFMLSTKAGGAGINLACANKVIIFDSGFNPQDEVQAENRAHRVGQTKEVEVVRLIAKGTIEEQIKVLGESKLAMGEGVAGEGASESDTKQVEKMGEQMVERMLMEDVKSPQKAQAEKVDSALDLKEAFKMGMEDEGLKVASKQAQF